MNTNARKQHQPEKDTPQNEASLVHPLPLRSGLESKQGRSFHVVALRAQKLKLEGAWGEVFWGEGVGCRDGTCRRVGLGGISQ